MHEISFIIVILSTSRPTKYSMKGRGCLMIAKRQIFMYNLPDTSSTGKHVIIDEFLGVGLCMHFKDTLCANESNNCVHFSVK